MQDIFVGGVGGRVGKRPPRPGRILRRLAAVGVVAFIVLILGYVAFRRATSASPPSGTAPTATLGTDGNRLTLGNSSLERVGDLWVLRLSGDPYAIGYAEGRLLGRRIGDAGAILDGAVLGEELGEEPGEEGGIGGFFRYARLRWRYRVLADGIAAARKLEVAGLAAGYAVAGLPHARTYQHLLWRETALDTGHTPGRVEPIGGLTSGLAFVIGFAAGPTTPTAAPAAPPLGGLGHTVVGRSFGLAGAAGPAPTVVSFVFPALGPASGPTSGSEGERLPFARVGWAGDVGVVTGVNSEGIVVCVDPATTEDVHPGAAAPPLPHLARDVLERAHTLDEAIAVLQAVKPVGSGSFLLVDGKAGNWAIVERTPTKVAVSRPKKPAVIGDVLVLPDFAKDADNDRARRTRPGGARRERLDELIARGVAADPASVAAVLRDRRGKADARLPVGSGNAIDNLAQGHVAIVDATSLTLWVSEGPGATGPLRAFDLRHELLGEPIRAAVRGGLPPDPVADLGATRAVVLAQAETATAERAIRAGRWAVAGESAARALALAPDLAEAHRAAADVAREQGDSAAATEHYRRYLDLGPADPGAAGEVRAILGGP